MASSVDGVERRLQSASASALLIHGLFADVDQMAPLQSYLADRAVESFSVRLPGHGTTPEDLAASTRADWYKAVLVGYRHVVSWGTRPVVIMGLSMGGALALLLAARESPVDGVVALSPAVFFENPAARLVPLLKHVVKYRQIDLSYIPEMYEIPYSRYAREPLSAVHEFIRLTEQVQRELVNVMAPALIVQSGADKTVSPTNGRRVYETISSEAKTLHVVEGAEHVITCHRSRGEAFALIGDFVDGLVGGVSGGAS